MLQVQFHDIKGSDLEQWKTDAKQTIVWPAKYATGKSGYPYTEAKKGGGPANRRQGGQQLEIASRFRREIVSRRFRDRVSGRRSIAGWQCPASEPLPAAEG